MPEKCNIPAEEREALFDLFPDCTSPEEDEELRQVFTQYLFYHRLDRKRRAYLCTACRDLWIDRADQYGHNDAYYCPRCLQRVTLKAVGRMGQGMTNVGYSSLFEAHNVVFFRRAEDGGLLVSGGKAEVIYRPGSTDGVGWPGAWDELDGLVWPVLELDFSERRRYYMAPSRLASWKRSYGYYNRGIFGFDYRQSDWDNVGSAGEPNPADGGRMSPQPDGGLYYVFGWPELERSALRYSAVEQAFDIEHLSLYRGVVSYLARYSRRPQVEMLTKLGHHDVIDCMLHDDLLGGVVNWRAKTPHGFFKLSKPDYKGWASQGGSLDVLRKWAQYDGKLSLAQFAGACAKIGNADAGQVLTIGERYGVRIGKLTSYLDGYVSAHTWLDYVSMAERVGQDLAQTDVLMPKDLQRRHDRLAEQIEYMENMENLKKYRRRLKALRTKYEMETAGYLIRVPTLAAEIRTEGNALKHCVGGYADRHMSGETTILFLRSSEQPDEPLCTIEMRSDGVTIRQIHGYRNDYGLESPMILYKMFLDIWLPWLAAGSRRDKQGRPILPKTDDTAITQAPQKEAV